MQEEIYCGSKGSFSVSGVIFKPGDRLTKKAKTSLSAKILQSLLANGTLTSSKVTVSGTPFLKTLVENPPKPTKLDTVGRWDVDPINLTSMNLQQLNIMVLERDPTMTPFETIEEAAAQLFKDFKGKIE